jgi:hypothetical protein
MSWDGYHCSVAGRCDNLDFWLGSRVVALSAMTTRLALRYKLRFLFLASATALLLDERRLMAKVTRCMGVSGPLPLIVVNDEGVREDIA